MRRRTRTPERPTPRLMKGTQKGRGEPGCHGMIGQCLPRRSRFHCRAKLCVRSIDSPRRRVLAAALGSSAQRAGPDCAKLHRSALGQAAQEGVKPSSDKTLEALRKELAMG